MRNHPGIRAALMAAAGTLALTAAACGATGTTASGPVANTGSSANTTASATATAGSGENSSGTVGGTGTTATTRPPTPIPSTTAKSNPSSGPGPVIVSFKVLQQPACPVAGTSDAPFSTPGQPVILAWKVTGATKVALSMDGGLYGSDYRPEDQQSLYFQCDTSRTKTTHTYTITTSGGGASRSQTLSVTISSAP
jgi:hypothetical protein